MASNDETALVRQPKEATGYPLLPIISQDVRPLGHQTWESMLETHTEVINVLARVFGEQVTPASTNDLPNLSGQTLPTPLADARLVFPLRSGNMGAGLVRAPLMLPLKHQLQTGDARLTQFYEPFLWSSKEPYLEVALRLLTDTWYNIQVVEYGAQLLHRLGCQDPEEIKRFEDAQAAEYHMQYFEWVIPDEQIALAARILYYSCGYQAISTDAFMTIDAKFPPNLGFPANVKIYGFSLPFELVLGPPSPRLFLIPMSAICMSITDTWLMFTTFHPFLNIYSPMPPRYILSLIRRLQGIAPGTPGRARFEDDLIKVVKGLLIDKRCKPFPKDSVEYSICVQEAIDTVRSWDEVVFRRPIPSYEEKMDCEGLEILEEIIRDLDFVRGDLVRKPRALVTLRTPRTPRTSRTLRPHTV